MTYHVSEFPSEGDALAYTEAQETVKVQGSFEGEQPWVVLAHDDYLNGCWEDGFEGEVYCSVDEHDQARWKLSPDTVAVHLRFSEQGFIYGTELNHGEHAAYLRDLEADAVAEGECYC